MEGVAPTLRASKGQCHSPLIEVDEPTETEPKIEVKGHIGTEGFEYVRKVYGTDGVSPTLLGNDRVNNVPKIEIPGSDESEGGESDE